MTLHLLEHARGSVKRRGFLTFDVASALALGLVLIMAMASVIIKQRAAENRLAAVRAAMRTVETGLLEMQTGQPAPALAIVEKLPDAAPANQAWVRLTLASKDGKPGASLVGLVPTAHLKKGDSR